jgi:uncharacterized membrane-anchored protein YjiN (DUF445 family)
MTGPVPGAPADDRQQQQRHDLRRMKLVAGGLLAVAAVLFVVCVTVGDGHGAWGYGQAATEAAMVGGIADWFAVTALFRHPLGLRIPHTAIIPRKKDQLGRALAGFVQQNFLNGPVVSERLQAAEIPRRAGEWLSDPGHAAALAADIGSGVGAAASVLRDDELRAAILGYVDQRLRATAVATPLARTIEAVRASGQHQVALTAALRGVMRFLDENRTVLRDRLEQESPDWVPAWVDERVFNRAFAGLQSFLADVISQDGHALRQAFDRRLADYAHELRTDPGAAAQAEEIKNRLLDRPDVHDWFGALWTQLKAGVLAESADPRSQLQRGLASMVEHLGGALVADPALRAKVDGWLVDAVHFLLTRYEPEVLGLISATVGRWDAADTGRRLELQVGRDLQFIRLNGTVVGSVVGVAIYTVAQLL